ncbi:MAG TPA: ionic transporter y4hA [Burkholderiales bacterium]|nr:ionic transporter y4hA [Burkholderiales bacterium]
MFHWSVVVPLIGVALLAAALNLPFGVLLGTACGIALVGVVVAAVHHAEVVAHRVGEPFGTLVLALAVTAIESSLIVSVMLAGGDDKAALARDTMYATVMIIANGVVGACVLLGALRHREQAFRIEGAGPGLAALATLATLVLVMPAFTVSAEGPRYTPSQLGFVAVSSLTVWCAFVFFQTVRHRDYFLPPRGAADETVHAAPPTAWQAWASFALLLVALVAVVGLAKVLSPSIESAVRNAGAPPAVVGIVIALLVLMPESIAAIRSALADRLQTSMNLALGSALATIGLTVPVVVGVCILLDIPLVLGLDPKEIALLALTFLVCTIGFGSGGRTSMMLGVVQLVIFAAFLFLAVVP